MRIKRITTFMLVLIILMATSITSFAALGDSQTAWIQANVTKAEGKIVVNDATLRSKLKAESSGGTDEVSIVLESGTIYYSTSDESVISAAVNKSINKSTASDKMTGLTSDLDITADTKQAGTMLSGLVPIINLVLGLIATVITFGMAISSALDIMYIAFPVFRNKTEDAKANGTGMMVKRDSNGNAQLRWVTDDAQYAVKVTVAEGNGASPWGVYFKKRVMSYVFLAIIMFILLTGNITLITDIAVRVISGIMSVLTDLA